MNVLLYGASGMVGQGVLRECLESPAVRSLRCVVRQPSGRQHPKLRELLCADLFAQDAIEAELSGVDACIWCIGVSSAGLDEAGYRRLTETLTLEVAERLLRRNPGLRFVYISAQGADRSERGPVMWARVRGRVENALLELPLGAAYMLRPGVIQPLHGIESRTAAYRRGYRLFGPLLTPLRALLPNWVLSTELVGRAVLGLLQSGARSGVLEPRQIREAASRFQG